MNTTKTSRAFTLIELLVVIAIIALLLAIMGPSLTKAKAQAQAVICRSNLRQWALVFYLYTNDNEESFPQSIASADVTAEDAWTLGALRPYYEDLDLRHCPSADYLWPPFPISIDEQQWWDSFAVDSYGFNGWIADPPPGVDRYWELPAANAVRTTFEKNARLIPMICDTVWTDIFPKMTDLAPSNDEHELDDYNATWYTDSMEFVCIDRHSGGINAAFVDMNVRHVGVKELWLLKWHAKWIPCMPANAWPTWTDIYKDYDCEW